MSELEKEFIAMRGALRKAFLLNVATLLVAIYFAVVIHDLRQQVDQPCVQVVTP